MYSAPGHSGVNHEDYLLGKAIDKAVDPLAANDEKVPTFIIWSTIQPYYFIYLLNFANTKVHTNMTLQQQNMSITESNNE